MSKKNKLIIIFYNHQLLLFLYNRKENGKIVGIIPFPDALSTDGLSISIPAEAKKLKEIILVLPDYVAGNSIYPFTSEKRSIAEPFIRRKLTETFPASPDISEFFNFSNFKTAMEPASIYAFYLKESIAFLVYNRLSEAGLRPDRITTPGYIWQDKIAKNADHESGKSFCIIHPLVDECQLYFYVNGNFLFSRTIKLPGPSEGNKEKLDALAFEISQSLYLFSQKVKSEISTFYIVPSTDIDEKGLSEKIGKNIQSIVTDSKEILTAGNKNLMPGPFSAFSLADIDSTTIPAISHRAVVMEKFWHTVQLTGIITGVLTLILLCAETAYFSYWSNRNILPKTASMSKDINDNRMIVGHYNEMLDLVMNERERPDPADIIAGIALSLPEKVTARELLFNLDAPSQVVIKGIVRADGPDSIKLTLSEMVEGLTLNLKPNRPPVIGDIGFDMEGSAVDQLIQGYKFHIKVDMK
ncbi:MAG: hypothetical protein EHM85_13010 [Desulfobacteraceae bacterium]|nr:MAG: hypothetical protein EHM85_13010 [Desulfobacteraceae bacterium]